MLLASSLWLTGQYGLRHAALMMTGGILGMVLYHCAFGFTAAWRVFLTQRRGRGVRAQMLMLGLAVLLFFPALDSGSLFGREVHGFIAPLGMSVVVGAFLFGLGMQLGGGCGSGTLFTAGGGNVRMIVTLAFFITGSVIGTAHFQWWQDLPALPPVSLVDTLGVGRGVSLNLALFAGIAGATGYMETKRHGRLEPAPISAEGRRRWLTGPWPLVPGAVALALLNFLTLALAGRPWGITSALALWGSKLLETLGGNVSGWAYWQMPWNQASLEASIWADVTSVMNIGIMLGALMAASLAGRVSPTWRIPRRSLLAAMIGGLLLGYGARLAFGCNIGAFFSGIASGSLHGWLWLIFAFLGNMVGVQCRRWFFFPPHGS
ncbi:YeeE/YedE family protein [Halomonas sp. 18H]|nr:YeeE/YedE family protein [Halomonas sp. 18H]MCW4152149.1 YeeE/YedE family protein [Halomonas sp. 18H]